MPIYLSCNYCGKKIVPEFTDSKTLTLPGTAFLESDTGRFPGGIFCSQLCHDDLAEAFDEWEKENKK